MSRRLRWISTAASAAVWLACASATPAVRSGPEAQAASGVEPWRIAETELRTQRLFRVQYDGPEGHGGFRLTLRLDSPDRYRLSAVDPLGRALWSLSVEGEEALWIDRRGERYCRLEGAIELTALPLGPFAMPALPAVLLGRPPLGPAAGGAAGGDPLEYHDRLGRRWRVTLDGAEVAGWTLYDDGEPVAWWSRQKGESVLSERRQNVQIRWRQVVSEPLTELGPAPEVPGGYVEDCA